MEPLTEEQYQAELEKFYAEATASGTTTATGGNFSDPSIFGAIFAGYGLVLLAILAFSLVANWKIVSKAGYNGAFSLLLLIPIVGLVFYGMFAFKDWPSKKPVS